MNKGNGTYNRYSSTTRTTRGPTDNIYDHDVTLRRSEDLGVNLIPSRGITSNYYITNVFLQPIIRKQMKEIR